MSVTGHGTMTGNWSGSGGAGEVLLEADGISYVVLAL